MIAIVDYGLGNIKAFYNLFKKLNINSYFASSSKELKKATKIILPGVGSFDYAMTMLEQSKLRHTLDDLVLNKRIPVFGICVGMQIMSDTSEEGILKGLGWVPGIVRKIDVANEISKYPLPHMGWNKVTLGFNDPLFENLEANPLFYFLHSYYFECKDNSSSLATVDYGKKITCILKHKNIYGIQCHPEKSHYNGETILKNFSNL
jgi:glutamine amidotransferase